MTARFMSLSPDASTSAVLVRVVGELVRLRLNPYFAKLAHYFENPQSWNAALAEHRAIRDAIAAHDPDAARETMREHLAFAGPLCAKLRNGSAVRRAPQGAAEREEFERSGKCRAGWVAKQIVTRKFVLKKLTIAFAASAAALLAATTSGMAQTKLKWAHVYETSEPFHTASVWAAGEIGKRTNGRYADRRLSGLAARQGDRHQPGACAGFGRHDHLRLEFCGQELPADRRDLLSLHLPRCRPSSPTPRATSSRSSRRATRTRPAIASWR